MKRDIPLLIFLTAIGIVLYIYLRTGEDTGRYDLTDDFREMADGLEETIYNRIAVQLEPAEYSE